MTRLQDNPWLGIFFDHEGNLQIPHVTLPANTGDTPMTLTVATFNIGNAHTIPAGADIYGMQEGSDQLALIREYKTQHPDFDGFRGDGLGGQAATPFLYRNNALREPVTRQMHLAVPRRYVGPGSKPGIPTVTKPKYIAHLHGGHTHILNTHFVPSVDHTPQRRKHYHDHVTALVNLVKRLNGNVIITGDFNAPPEFDLLQPLHKLGFIGWTQQGTHGNRNIDHVIYLPNEHLSSKGEKIIPTGSDHDAVIRTFDRKTK